MQELAARRPWVSLVVALVLAVGSALAGCSNGGAPQIAEADLKGAASRAGASCSVELSPFAKKSVALLEARYCAEAKEGEDHANVPETSAVQKERDTIFMLLAFAAVDKAWDTNRGHAIGAVIVEGDRVSKIALNSNYQESSPVEHAEVRAIRGYFADAKSAGSRGSPGTYLQDATIYGTLEPCQMCAGTINMAKVRRVVFGVKDLHFGDAMNYLHAFPYRANFEMNDATRSAKAFNEIIQADPEASLTPMLARKRDIFHWAAEDLASFRVTYPDNEAALGNARRALEEL